MIHTRSAQRRNVVWFDWKSLRQDVADKTPSNLCLRRPVRSPVKRMPCGGTFSQSKYTSSVNEATVNWYRQSDNRQTEIESSSCSIFTYIVYERICFSGFFHTLYVCAADLCVREPNKLCACSVIASKVIGSFTATEMKWNEKLPAPVHGSNNQYPLSVRWSWVYRTTIDSWVPHEC